MSPARPRSSETRPLYSSHSHGIRAYRADAPMRSARLSILSAFGLVLAGLLAGCMDKTIDMPFKGTMLATDVTGSLAGSPRSFSLELVDSQDRPLVSDALDRALDPMSDSQPVRWGEGAHSRGSVTARGRAFIFEDQICRGFHVVIERSETPKSNPSTSQSSYQGAACRQGQGGQGHSGQGLGEWRIVSGLTTEL